MAIYHEDIADINLNGGSLHRSFKTVNIGSGDQNANRFGMRVYRDGEAVDLSGVSCQAVFQDPMGNNIALTSHGTVSGNVAFVTLPQECYNYEGNFCLAIKLIGGGVTGTMRIIDGVVDNTHTGGAVAPTSAVPTYQEVLAAYDDAIAAVEDVNELKKELNSLDYHVRYETEEVVAKKSVSATSGTKIDATESEFNVSIASGASFRFCASGTNLINKFALYYNEGGSSHRFGSNLSPNTDYDYTAPVAITSLYIYTGSTDVIGSGTLKLTVSNVVHNNDSVDKHITDLESDVEELSFLGNRIDYNDTLIGGNIGALPSAWFERGGSIVSNGVVIKIDEQTFRVRSIRDMVLDYDLTLMPNSGYRIYVYIYSNGSWAQYGWITTPYNIPAKTIFRVLIAQKPEDTSSTADVNTYCSNITLSFPLKKVIDSVSPVETLALETMKSIAHRGNVALAPQNTKPAYIMARKKGALWAENDVAKTADGYYVMWHDTTLKKLGDMVDISGYLVYTDGTTFYYYDSDNSVLYTFENGDYVVSSASISGLTRCNGNNYSVETLNYADIRRFDFGAWFDKQYAGTQILNFAEWVLLCKQLGMKIYIDHKFTYTQSQAQDLVAIVKRYGMLRNAVWLVMPTVAVYIRQVDSEAIIAWIPNVATYPNIDDAITYINGFNLNASGNCIIEMDGKSMTETDAQKILNANYMCEAYYVDYGSTTEQQIFEKIRALSEYGVQGLTLDKYNVADAFYYLIS